MTIKQLAVFAAAILFATAAVSGEKNHAKIEIKVISDGADGNTHLVLDSDDMDFELQDMQVGENQSIVDGDGRAVLVTRTEDGFSFNVDGKTIDMPDFTKHENNMVWSGDHEFAPESDIDVRVMRMHKGAAPHTMAMGGMPGVMILSGEEIDEDTQQIIRMALNSAGHDEVHFTGTPGHGLHRIEVVSKVVEVID